jgi:hypothetical protein
MTAMTASHPAPHREPVRLWLLLLGMVAAPGFWLAQLMLSYAVSAAACYGGDHPTSIASGTAVRTALFVFDAVALIAALAGGIVSYASWRAAHAQQQHGQHHALEVGEGRARFMALWGIMSSLCFLGAIGFNAIGSIMAPLCVR